MANKNLKKSKPPESTSLDEFLKTVKSRLNNHERKTVQKSRDPPRNSTGVLNRGNIDDLDSDDDIDNEEGMEVPDADVEVDSEGEGTEDSDSEKGYDDQSKEEQLRVTADTIK